MKTDIIMDIRRDSAMNVIVTYLSGKNVAYRLDRFLKQAESILTPDNISFGLSKQISLAGGLLAYLYLDDSFSCTKEPSPCVTKMPSKPRPVIHRELLLSPPRLKRLIRI